MFDLIFAMIALAASADPANKTAGIQPSVAPQAATVQEAAPPAGLVAEDQTPTGKFTTATEVKPILGMTKANWVGVREYGGNDLLYLTHLWAWRCGLVGLSLSVNDGPFEEMPLPECHMEFATPNAILDGDGLPYLTYPQGSVARVRIEVIYDDLSRDSADFERSQIRIP